MSKPKHVQPTVLPAAYNPLLSPRHMYGPGYHVVDYDVGCGPRRYYWSQGESGGYRLDRIIGHDGKAVR